MKEPKKEKKPFRPLKDKVKKLVPEIAQERLKKIGFREIIKRMLNTGD